jgi:hypothetical protein
VENKESEDFKVAAEEEGKEYSETRGEAWTIEMGELGREEVRAE